MAKEGPVEASMSFARRYGLDHLEQTVIVRSTYCLFEMTNSY